MINDELTHDNHVTKYLNRLTALVCTYMCVYIYIYTHTKTRKMCVYIYIYIYIYIHFSSFRLEQAKISANGVRKIILIQRLNQNIFLAPLE